jgi:ATP-dependent Clp protease protease subunit
MKRNDFYRFSTCNLGVSGSSIDSYVNKMNSIHASYISPTILEERQMNVTQMDVFSRLMMDNIIFLGTGIDDTVANIINAQLLFLASKDQNSVNLYVNSPGGGVYSGLSIVDTMNYIPNKVNTLVCGLAASMGFIISICGDYRSALKHSRFLLHQPMSGVEGQASDITIVANEVNLSKKELYNIVVDKTGQPFEKVEKDGDRDFWMTAQEAKEYGAVDEIVERKKEKIS